MSDWQDQTTGRGFTYMLHCDAAAVSIGRLVLAMLLLLNGGGVWLLTIAGGPKPVLFAVGLIVSGFAAAAAYFYQISVTHLAYHDHMVGMGYAAGKRPERAVSVYRIAMLLLAWTGFGLFAVGTALTFIN